MGDPSDSSLDKTVLFGEMRWLPPVENFAALPAGQPDHTVCYLQDESVKVEVVNGVWTRLPPKNRDSGTR